MQEIKLTQDKRLSKQYNRLAFFALKIRPLSNSRHNRLGGICWPCWCWYDHDQIVDIFIRGHIDQTIIANTIQTYDHKAVFMFWRGNGYGD